MAIVFILNPSVCLSLVTQYFGVLGVGILNLKQRPLLLMSSTDVGDIDFHTPHIGEAEEENDQLDWDSHEESLTFAQHTWQHCHCQA